MNISALFDQILDRSDIGLAVVDQQHRVVLWNDWLKRFSQISRENVLGKTLFDLFSSADISRISNAITDVLQSGVDAEFSQRIQRAPLPLYCNERTQLIEQRLPHHVQLKRIVAGEDFYCLIQIFDTTQLGVRENRLREQVLDVDDQARRQALESERVRAMLDSSHDAIFSFGSDGIIDSANAATERLFNYSRDELVGKTLSELVPSLAQGNAPIIEKLQRKGLLRGMHVGLREVMTARRCNGSHFQIDLLVREMALAGDIQYLGIVRDMTEEQTMRHNLHIEKEMSNVALKNISDAVITTDANGIIHSVNPIAEQLLVHRAANLLGTSIEKAFALRLGEQGEQILNPVLIALEQGRVIQSSENTIVETSEGENLPVICSAAPIRDSAQNIIGCVLVFRDISEARRVARRLNWQSSHDSLTNLPNRHYFEDELSHLVRNAKQMDSQHVLLFLDLDQFKVVNDSCGHVAGDELLRQLGQQMQDHVRRGDVVARLGGDEFGVLLPNCPTAAGEKVAETLRQVIMNFRFSWRGTTFAAGVSIGIVPITAATESASSALTVADAACYSAKDVGRNQIHVYEPDDTEYQKRHGQMQWVTRIQEAIAEDRFCLFCQPIVPVTSLDKKPSHYEILIRMIDHDGKIIAPAAFIPVAERFRLMMDIDRWVVTHALNKISEIDLGDDLKIFYAINLSGVSLGNVEFLHFVQDQISRSSVRPEQICFEITETAAISNISRAIALITTLKNMGCYFALDDFGSGLSSFAYLKELPVDFLKIDGEFVRDMDKNPIDEAMVSAINHLGHVMGIKTVAEFVENDAIMQKLREIGVDYAQGYGVSKQYLIDDLKRIKKTA